MQWGIDLLGCVRVYPEDGGRQRRLGLATLGNTAIDTGFIPWQ